MSLKFRSLFILLLLFFIVHTIRDILQLLHVHIWLSDTYRTNHPWCRPYCDYAVLPHELFGIVSASIIIKRNKAGILGLLTILAFFLMWVGFITDALKIYQ